jgi:hypothetical protein
MKRAIILHTRPGLFGGDELDTGTTIVEDADDAYFYARVTGTVQGLVGEGSLPGTAIVSIKIEEV